MTTATLTREDTGQRREFSRDYCGELAVINKVFEAKHAAVWPQMRRELDVLFAADLDELIASAAEPIRDTGPETAQWAVFADAPTDVVDHAFDGDAVAAYMAADTSSELPGRVPGDGHPELAQAYAERLAPPPEDTGWLETAPIRKRASWVPQVRKAVATGKPVDVPGGQLEHDRPSLLRRVWAAAKRAVLRVDAWAEQLGAERRDS